MLMSRYQARTGVFVQVQGTMALCSACAKLSGRNGSMSIVQVSRKQPVISG